MPPNPNASIIQMVPLIFLFVVFYFFLMRPQQKKQKEHAEMIKNIKKNDEIVTAGGVHGTIVNVKDKTFALRVDENVKIEIDKSSVGRLEKVR